MQLFLVVLGGRLPRCHVECHDVRWVVAESIEGTIPELKRQWIGPQKGLHLDSYCQVKVIDGHRINVQPGVGNATAQPSLWFVNLGAYNPDELAEQHQFGLVVAQSQAAAKATAKRRWLKGLQQRHHDDLHAVVSEIEVDGCLPIDGNGAWHLTLTPTASDPNDSGRPDWFGYRPI